MAIKKPRSIKEILINTLAQYKLPINLEEANVFNLWDSIVGDQIATHTKPRAVKLGRLTVDVDSPIWRHQLTFMKKTIIDKLNSAMEKSVIRDIRFTLNVKMTSKDDPKMI